jgi:hypothetical protein
MIKKITTLIVFAAAVVPASAAPLGDYQFKSPSFNGAGYSSHVLAIESTEMARAKAIQDAFTAAQQAEANKAANLPINQFLVNLESRIYAQISQNLATAMFAGGNNTSGTIDFQGNTINWINQGNNIKLTIFDPNNSQTIINVPILGVPH